MNLNSINIGGVTLDSIIILVNVVITLVLLILLINTKSRLNKMKKNYDVFLSGKEAKSLEDILIKKFNLLSLLDESVKDLYVRVDAIDKNLLITYQKMGLVKYDAFKEAGGKMSFVLALLTKENNGIIINSIHSNADGCYTYVKRIENGECKMTSLSKEEEVALKQAMGISTAAPKSNTQ